MPNYKKHIAGGFAGYLIILSLIIKSYNPTLTTALQWLLSTIIGSLFPDIDTKSKFQKIFYFGLLILFIILTIQNNSNLLIFISFLGLIPLVVNHRGIFHKLWFILLLSALIIFVTNLYAPAKIEFISLNLLFFLIGVISHLWLDLGIKKMLKV